MSETNEKVLIQYIREDKTIVLMKVRPEMTGGEVLRELGYPIYDWRRARMSVDGRALGLGQTLSQVGVRKGSRLEIQWRPLDGEEEDSFDIPMIPLYGCPTAAELPGAVPACMLSAPEGFETVEL